MTITNRVKITMSPLMLHAASSVRIPTSTHSFQTVFLLEIRKRKRRSHGKRQKGNEKRKRCAAQKSGTSLYNLSSKLREHGRHAMLSFLSSLPIPVLRVLDIEANRFYDRNHQMYEAALLTRCYTQHALRPFIDAEN